MRTDFFHRITAFAIGVALVAGAAWAQSGAPAPNHAAPTQRPAAASGPDAGSAAPGHSDQPITDTWITAQVKLKLATADGVASRDISVTTKDGVVQLSGSQATPGAVNKARSVARAVDGVKRVDAKALKVGRP